METTRVRAIAIALLLACVGLFLILLGGSFKYKFYNLDVQTLISNIGGLLLVVGILQWAFEYYIRNSFFRDVRSETLGLSQIVNSGLSDYRSDSKDIDFKEYFLSSKNCKIGVNYSPKLIDNCIRLIRDRFDRGLNTEIYVLDPKGSASKYLENEYKVDGIDINIKKISSTVKQIDPDGRFTRVFYIDSILRYSFVEFDSRVWVVVATNGRGRRAVPGFFVRQGGSWFDHFKQDIGLLTQEAVDSNEG